MAENYSQTKLREAIINNTMIVSRLDWGVQIKSIHSLFIAMPRQMTQRKEWQLKCKQLLTLFLALQKCIMVKFSLVQWFTLENTLEHHGQMSG